MRWSTHIGHKVAQLLCHGQQHFIFIIIAVCQEGDQLCTCALLAQGQGDGAEPLNGVEPPNGLIVLELVSAGAESVASILASMVCCNSQGCIPPEARNPHKDGYGQQTLIRTVSCHVGPLKGVWQLPNAPQVCNPPSGGRS